MMLREIIALIALPEFLELTLILRTGRNSHKKKKTHEAVDALQRTES